MIDWGSVDNYLFIDVLREALGKEPLYNHGARERRREDRSSLYAPIEYHFEKSNRLERTS